MVFAPTFNMCNTYQFYIPKREKWLNWQINMSKFLKMYIIRLILIIAFYSLLNCSCMEQNSRKSNSSSLHTNTIIPGKPTNKPIAEDSIIAANNQIINAFGINLAKKSRIITTSDRGNLHSYSGNNMKDGNLNTYWSTDDSVRKASIVIDLIKAHQLNYLLLSEYLPLGERIKRFTIDVFIENRWEDIAEGHAVGKLKIINLQGINTAWIRINIEDSSDSPAISEIEIY